MSLVDALDFEPVEISETEKQQVWRDIKVNLPGFAEFMLDLKKSFGELRNVEFIRGSNDGN